MDKLSVAQVVPKIGIATILFIFMGLNSNAHAQVMLMSDSQVFIKNATYGPGYGTISTVYAMLFKKIGAPKNLHLTPLNRQNRILDQLDYAACSLYRFKNHERSKKYAFSEMVYFQLHYKLYQQIHLPPLRADILNDKGQVRSLSALFTTAQDNTLLTIPAYSYGNVLDEQLAALPIKAKVEWSGNDPHNRLSSMFFAQRADFALMFPAEVADYARKNLNASFRRYDIAGVDSVTKGYMMCNKHPDSYAFIDKVNQALPALYSTQAYLKAHMDYYDESEHETIATFISQFKL